MEPTAVVLSKCRDPMTPATSVLLIEKSVVLSVLIRIDLESSAFVSVGSFYS